MKMPHLPRPVLVPASRLQPPKTQTSPGTMPLKQKVQTATTRQRPKQARTNPIRRTPSSPPIRIIPLRLLIPIRPLLLPVIPLLLAIIHLLLSPLRAVVAPLRRRLVVPSLLLRRVVLLLVVGVHGTVVGRGGAVEVGRGVLARVVGADCGVWAGVLVGDGWRRGLRTGVFGRRAVGRGEFLRVGHRFGKVDV